MSLNVWWGVNCDFQLLAKETNLKAELGGAERDGFHLSTRVVSSHLESQDFLSQVVEYECAACTLYCNYILQRPLASAHFLVVGSTQ
jgi:hypothetical protein